MFWHRSIVSIIALTSVGLLNTSVAIARSSVTREVTQTESISSLVATSHIFPSRTVVAFDTPAPTSLPTGSEATIIPNGSDDLSIEDLAKLGKQITVTIDNLENRVRSSGVIVDRQDDTYTILTTKYAFKKGKKYRLTALNSISYDFDDRAVKLADNDLDLAVVTITLDRSYSTAKFGNSSYISEGTTLYKAGYTELLENLAAELVYTFKSASLLSIVSTKDSNHGYQLVDNNPLSIGSIGGPIVDVKGLLVGIQGRAAYDRVTKKSLGIGIPIEQYINNKDRFTATLK